MAAPLFFVIARVVGRDQALNKWRERLAALCAVSKTEPYSNSYYWGQDLNGEPDTLWGLEGYYHPIGFFMGHVSTDTFKAEMRKVDEDELLRNVQGLGSPDYDLHHYDLSSGFVKRQDDANGDQEDSFVAVVHFWATDGQRKRLLAMLADCAARLYAAESAPSITCQSFAVLKELNDINLATIYVRTTTRAGWESLQETKIYKQLLADITPIVIKQEAFLSHAFIGHIGQ